MLSSVLFSCKKNDIEPATLHEQNFTAKFFATKTAPSKELAAIIEKLKAENERTGFVNKLPANCGLPVWKKIAIQKQAVINETFYSPAKHGPSANLEATEDSTENIIIPLTITNNNLSAVIIVEDINNAAIINCYTTNGTLYNVTHGAGVDTTLAMQQLALFFYMENRTYGTTKFYHIPASLFANITSLDSNGDKILSVKTITDTATGSSSLVPFVCVSICCGICNGNDPNCPNGGCATHCTYGGGGNAPGEEGGDPPGGGGSGGPGGGGNPGGCPFNGSWYNLVPPVGGCDDPPPPTPPGLPNQNIIDSLQGFPCAQNILAQLPNINNETRTIINNVFNVNEDVNLILKAAIGYTRDSIDGYSDYPRNPNPVSFTEKIFLNPWVMQNSAQEYTLAVMYHESIHAYINYWRMMYITNEIDSNQFKTMFPIFWDPTRPRSMTEMQHHNEMAMNYVIRMKNVIQSFNPNVHDSVATAIAWGGLENTTAWFNKSDTVASRRINWNARTDTVGTTSVNIYKLKRCLVE